MKIHLEKIYNVGGIVVHGLACSNSPFTNGAVRSREEFAEVVTTRPQVACKRCLQIAAAQREKEGSAA